MQKIIIICGPTGVGKTRTAMELAKDFGGEIVSADSQQIYKGLDIGTAKPAKAELAAIPHHLISVINPDEPFDAARYVRLADDAISLIVSRGHIPFVVGGTGLYIRALERGLMKSPGRDEQFRKELAKMKESYGISHLFNILKNQDPKSAAILKENDTARIIRALEIFHLTGQSITELQSSHRFSEKRYDALKIGLNMPRNELYERINKRVDEMIKNGLVNEVANLVKKYGPDIQALKAVGYKEIAAARPNITAETIELIKQNTRRYAKRQLTWFRADREILWFD